MKIKNRILIMTITLVIAVLVSSCASIPKNVNAVENFELNRYLGTWYEVARFDFHFEKDLNNVSAQYNLNNKGKVRVVNSGYNYKKGKWKKSKGIAKFRSRKDVAALKVSFFRPFYSSYNVVALDKDYQYALIAGRNLDYLWILSRQKSIPEAVKNKYLKIAQEIGYETSKLIWIEHNRSDNPYLKED